ncbi:MAG: PilZ domain-containing protein [Deltaproteobacteria bacterium]|nr:PilZ domain-containing protein [Deltaproteobacteria bacterium]
MRVPVRGTAVLHALAGAVHGTLENLSHSGALLNVPAQPRAFDHEVELRLIDGSGTVSARTVRVDRTEQSWQIAVAFDRVDPAMRASIDASIASALLAARRRPILLIDPDKARLASLIDRLAGRGMTPLAPRTPLDTIDLLTRAQLQIGVCMLAPGSSELASVLADSFPWVTTSDITDDLDGSVDRAIDTWSTTPVARLGVAIG